MPPAERRNSSSDTPYDAPSPLPALQTSPAPSADGSPAYASAPSLGPPSPALFTPTLSALGGEAEPQTPVVAPAAFLGTDGGVSLQRLSRAVAARFGRAMRRGNLPFLIVFITALVFFFSALAGIGYVDPDAVAPAAAGGAHAGEGGFRLGGPVFHNAERAREVAIAEQKQLEDEWSRKKRPNAGAWMQKQRDDKAVRLGAPKADRWRERAPPSGEA